MTQDEFNFSGEDARDEGIDRVVGNTPEEYRTAFHNACYSALSKQGSITSEDITRMCGMPPNHPHAVGGLMFGLVKSGVIVPVGDAKSVVRTSHAARLRLYCRAA